MTKRGSRISLELGEAIVCAETEDEVREIVAKEDPDMKISSIVRGEAVDDD
jgi:hypothetical protein